MEQRDGAINATLEGFFFATGYEFVVCSLLYEEW